MKVISIQYDSVFTTNTLHGTALIDVDLSALYKINRRPPMLRAFSVLGTIDDVNVLENQGIQVDAWIETQSEAQIVTSKDYAVSIATDFPSGGGVVTKSNRICLASRGYRWTGKVDLFDKIRIGVNWGMLVNITGAIGDKLYLVFNLEIDV